MSLPPTVLEVLRKTADFLARKGVETPRLEAELLLAGALDCKRLDLYLRFDQPLAEAQLGPLREQVARRARREPLQYIAGKAPFMDFEVACDRRALIPRPETEGLAELIFSKMENAPAAVLDLGTGTGVLALACARRWPECRVVATDASEDALALAKANAAALGLAERITFLPARWFEGVTKAAGSAGQFNLIASNPPYLTEAEWETAAPEVRDWEPQSALVAGDEGLADLRVILENAPARLNSGGLLALETGIAQHAALAALANASHDATGSASYARVESARDLGKRDRYFLAWRA